MTEAPRFPALRTIAGVLRVATYGVVALLLLSAMVAFQRENALGMFACVGAAILSLVSGLVMPELIGVLLAIEENTRLSRTPVEQVVPNENPRRMRQSANEI